MWEPKDVHSERIPAAGERRDADLLLHARGGGSTFVPCEDRRSLPPQMDRRSPLRHPRVPPGWKFQAGIDLHTFTHN